MAKDFLIMLVFVVLFVAMLLVGANYLANASCSASWPNTPHNYSFITGCMVESSPGLWIPAHNYRQF